MNTSLIDPSRFPRLGLAHLPTPLEPMKRLTAALGGPRLWIKREDCTGVGLGGNKLRKLDYVLHEAVAAGADTLVSGGVVQSNSQRQVAAAAAKLGLACHLAVYHGRLAPPSADYEASGNALLNRLFGATLHDVPWTGNRNGGCAPTLCVTAAPLPPCLTDRSTSRPSRSLPAMPPGLWRAACGDGRGHRVRGAAGGAGARPGLFRQGAGRFSRPGPCRTMDKR